MGTSRKIKTGCYAIVRGRKHLGIPVTVIVGKRHNGYRGIPPIFETDDGEYQASELKRISAEEYARYDEQAEFNMW